MSGGGIERRAVIDRRAPTSNANDLHVRLEEKRLAIQAERRQQLRRQSEQYEFMECQRGSSIGQAVAELREQARDSGSGK